MSNDKKRDYINISILIAVFLLIIFSIVGFNYVNGSTVDWDSQHVVIPEYFRNLFYDTKDIFPSFAFNLGAGENIYNLSYYGLLNPFILLSYLLPNIPMIKYIEISMICIVISSIICMYFWLRRRFDSKYSFIGTLLFLVSAPLIYHTHRHIMFINYMPFLILGLYGVDRYFEKNKKTLLILSIFLTIMTSYYYSVGSILCIIAYGIFKYIEINKRVKFAEFIKDGFKFIFPITVGILMSGILILPTFYALLNNRNDITASINLFHTLIPEINLSQILYNSYTIGVTSILILAIAFGLSGKKKENKFLAIVFLLFTVFPFLTYALSGFMYVRGKVLIPFLPLAILFITITISSLNTKRNNSFIILLAIFSIIQIIVHINNKQYIFIVDVLILLITYLIYLKKSNKNIIIYPLCLVSLICSLTNNYTEKLVTKEDISIQYSNYNYNKLSKLIDEDENIYRVNNDILGMKNANRVADIEYYLPSIYSSLENKYYYDFVTDKTGSEMESRISTGIIGTKNIIINTMMGNKYLITDSSVPIGYKSIENSDIYVNENVYPIAYVSTDIMSQNEYNNLTYPYNIEALSQNIIIKHDIKSEFESNIKEEKIDYEKTYENIKIEKTETGYLIESEENGNMTIKLDNPYKEKMLFISFEMNYSESCLIGDTHITINGVTNTLSCRSWTYHNKNYNFEYVISSNEEIDKLFIEFTKGKYEISNIKVYSLDYNNLLKSVKNVDVFNFNKELTKGDEIVGDINVTENGYFKISIPYEKDGFSVYVDNKLTEYELVDNAFIGFPITEGHHTIKIVYISPYLLEGMVASICGYMIFLPIIYSDIIKKKKKN